MRCLNHTRALGLGLALTLSSSFGLGCAHAGNAAVVLTPPAPVPADAAVTHSQGTFTGAGGVALFEQSWHPSGDARAVVVVMHGLKDHSSHYADAAEAWAKKGIAVYAFDLRGHGRSTGDAVWVEKFSDYEDDLDVFVKKVAAAEPNKPLFVFGHSMGGAIVTLWSLDKTPHVAGLVLSAPALKAGSDVSPGLIAVTGLLGGLCPGLGVLDLKNEAFSRDAAVVSAMAVDPYVHQDPGPARTASELLGAIAQIQQRMEEESLPFLALHGTADKLTNPEGSEELLKRAASKDKSLKLYDGFAHDLLHEPEKARVFDDISAWLDAHIAAQ